MTEKASLNRDAFLFCVSQTGNMTVAADFIGTSREQIMAEMTQDAGFAKQVKKAIEESFDRLLYQAHQRALYGVKVPHFYQGELIGYSARPSDRLLCYLLKRMETALPQEDETACESHIDVEHIRHVFNAILDKRQPAARLIQEICATIRAIFFWSGGRLHFAQDKPTSPVRLVNNQGIEDGRFRYAGPSMRRALRRRDFAQAAKEALDSKWAKQVPHRAREIAKLIQQD